MRKSTDITIRKDANVVEADPITNLLDPELIGSAILQCFMGNDPEGVMEMIEDYLYALNKSNFLREGDKASNVSITKAKKSNN